MIRVAITGNLGSGKTTVSKLFMDNNIPVFNSDISARKASNDPHVQEGFKRILGDDIYIDGVLDVDRMRSIMFRDKIKLGQINELVIPFVRKEFNGFCLEHEGKVDMVMLESAILFETNTHTNFDYIITVIANEKKRIKRVKMRDNASKREIYDKINNQLPEEVKISKADFIIVNDGNDLIDSIDMLNKQVNTIIKAIRFDLIKG